MEPIFVFGMPSFAGTPWINARQNTQQHRIFKGVQSGELNFNETKSCCRPGAHAESGEPGRRLTVSLHRSSTPASTPRKISGARASS